MQRKIVKRLIRNYKKFKKYNLGKDLTMKYPKIKKAEVLEDYFLGIFFNTGEIKIYDFKSNFQYEIFSQLKDQSIFKNVAVDIGGYGISWNDDCDLSEQELYLKGI